MLSIGKALCVILLFTSINWMNSFTKKPPLVVSMQDVAFNFSYEMYQFLSMGNNRLISSLMWVQSLLESDTEHYKQKDLNSWLYVRFDHILKLEPKFLAAYLFGGQYLSIIKDDDKGALDIYERGLKAYPNDYDLNYNAAFHYLFELGEIDKAIKLYDKIKYDSEAPSYLPSLVARLKLEQGASLPDILGILLEAYNKAPEDSQTKASFAEKIYAVKAEIDLDCLNSGQLKCQTQDFEGKPYLKNQSGEYQAQKTWAKYRLHKRDE